MTDDMDQTRENECTRFVPVSQISRAWWKEMQQKQQETTPSPVYSLSEAFAAVFPKIQKAYRNAALNSYLLVCVSPQGELQIETIPLEPEQFVFRIAGRHTKCHITMRENPGISLRHLLIRMHLTQSGQPLFKVLNLATSIGFFTIQDRQVHGIHGIGHAVFHIGGYYFFLIFRDNSPLPDTAEKALDGLNCKFQNEIVENPFEKREELLDPRQIKPRIVPIREKDKKLTEDTFFGRSSVWVIQGPQYLDEFENETSAPEADANATRKKNSIYPDASPKKLFLLVQDSEAKVDVRIAVKAKQLERGILVGRYKRCDIGETNFHISNDVSRVHLVLIKDEGRFFVIDASSTNGTWVDDESISALELKGVTRMHLGGFFFLTWMPV